MTPGLPERLRMAFLIQAAIAALIILVGAGIAVQTAKRDVAASALREEADYFWDQRAADPGACRPTAPSCTATCCPSAVRPRHCPLRCARCSPACTTCPICWCWLSSGDDMRLYLTYPRSKIDHIAMRLVLAPVLLALLLVAASSWLTYRLARRMTSPLHWLAKEVQRWDPRDPDTSMLAPDKLPQESGIETRQLAGALQRMGDRMRSYMHRERDFTRDASHELRTPLTVIRVASDLMQSDPDLPERAHRSLARIQRAGRDMEAVIDAFLLLARESEVEPQREDFHVRDVVDEEVEKVRPLLAGKPDRVVDQRARIATPARIAARAGRHGRQPARQRLHLHRARTRGGHDPA